MKGSNANVKHDLLHTANVGKRQRVIERSNETLGAAFGKNMRQPGGHFSSL
jgi:hypothetical protein